MRPLRLQRVTDAGRLSGLREPVDEAIGLMVGDGGDEPRGRAGNLEVR